MNWGNSVTYLGSTTLKERAVRFGIKDVDRLRHLCVLGASNTDRTELLVHMALQDIARGVGTVVFDASGTVTPLLIERLDPALQEKVIYLDPAAAEYPFMWNPLNEIRTLPAAEREEHLTTLLLSLYQVPRSPFVEYVSGVLLRHKNATLISFHALVTDEKAREVFFEHDEVSKKEFEEKLKEDTTIAPVLEEEGRYVAKDTLIRNLLGQVESKFSLSELSNGGILIIDFSHIHIFPTRMRPLMRTFLESVYVFGATEHPISVFLHDGLRYLSEEEIERMLAPCGIAFTLADTAVHEENRALQEFAVSRCGSVVSFATHPSDKTLIERVFYPYADAEELVRLGPREMILALSIDGVRTRPFFATAFPMPPKTSISYQDLIVAARTRYTTTRTKVDAFFKSQKGGGKDDAPPAGRRGPGGFQDAFRSIMANRAQNLPLKGLVPDAQDAKTEKKEAEPTKEKKNQNEKPPRDTTVSEDQKNKKNEVPEDVLKKLLFVVPVSAWTLFLFMVPQLALAVTPAQFSFITPVQTIPVNAVSDTITVEAEDAGGAPVKGTTLCVEVTSSSQGGEFSTNGTDWGNSPIRTLELTLASNQYRRNMYFRSSVEGSFTLTLAAAPRPDGTTCTEWSGASNAEWTASQSILIGTISNTTESGGSAQDNESSTGTGQTSSEYYSATTGVLVPSAPTISAYAGEDRTVVVGADSAFSARATGIEGAPLENARYVWSFGNGDRREGQSVLYNFAYPGTYVVVLDVGSGVYSASDRIMVRAVPAMLSVTNVTSDYIALKNGGSGEVDIGGWLLFSSGKQFQFPPHTILTAGQEVLVSNKRTGLSGTDPGTVALQYPNGLVATSYEYPLFLTHTSATSELPQAAPALSPSASAGAPSAIASDVDPQELITAPIVATGQNRDRDGEFSSLVLWLAALITLIVGTVVSIVYIRKDAHQEYAIQEVRE